MRKDAKIGFAIGGVLLAVLTVYAIVVPKHKKTTGTVAIYKAPAPSVDSGSSQQPPVGMIATDGANTPVPGPTAPAMDAANPPVTSHPADTVASNTPGPNIATPAPVPGTTDTLKPEDPKPLDKPGLIPDNGPMVSDPPTDATHGKIKTMQMVKPAAPELTASDRTYVVQPGQTLSKIASEVFDNSRFWVAIQRENPSIDPNHLKVGTKIKLPDISPIRPGTVEQVSVDRVVVASHRETPVDARSYVVKPGDSLYKIARTLLGTGRKADALYAINKAVIGPDKTRLKLGMVLKLPDTDRLARVDMIR